MTAKDARALYQALILDHGNAPRREGPLEGHTHHARQVNPLCGDRVTVRLTVREGTIEALRFEARGCLISRASASLMGELVEGTPVAEARTLAAKARALVATAGPPPEDLGPLEVLRPVRDFPARAACAELPWKALADALAA